MNFQLLKILYYLPLLISVSADFTFPKDLNEGSTCIMEDGKQGTCIKQIECPEKLKATIEGKRNHLSSDHCGFVHQNEIVCCPSNETIKTEVASMGFSIKPKLRIAEKACKEMEKKFKLIVRPYIVEGKPANVINFPFMAALGYEQVDKSIEYNCGGTLISYNFVLTAAHCVTRGSKPVEVRLGSDNLKGVDSNYVQIVPIDKIYPHPDYDLERYYNDVALLTLKHHFPLTEYVKPACIQPKPVLNLDLSNYFIIATGFGDTQFGYRGSKMLRKTNNLSLVKESQCNANYREPRRLSHGIDSSMLCCLDPSKTGRSDTCQGDSGGPLVMVNSATKNTLLIGVTSFGDFCGGPVPGVYASVYYYLDWIESMVWGNYSF